MSYSSLAFPYRSQISPVTHLNGCVTRTKHSSACGVHLRQIIVRQNMTVLWGKVEVAKGILVVALNTEAICKKGASVNKINMETQMSHE